MDDARIGKNLAALRVSAGLSQGELAEQIGVAQQTVAKMEKGTRPLKYAEAVAISERLSIPLSALADTEGGVESTAVMLTAMHQINSVESFLERRAHSMARHLWTIASRLNAIKLGRRNRPRDWEAILDRATAYLETDWGSEFNDKLTHAVRSRCFDVGVLAEVDDVSYQAILTKLANTDFAAASSSLDTAVDAEPVYPSLGRGLAQLMPPYPRDQDVPDA
ncbi:helix-turn-helix domain-containing protein [Mycolicibacterium canariasense]|uniref:helix-turn-helix domain-containing protein n=1 Tax=Mycolicibacterium canariasense TaxID=228230 RepID=UPI0032D593B0